jgi:hypothetical protein
MMSTCSGLTLNTHPTFLLPLLEFKEELAQLLPEFHQSSSNKAPTHTSSTAD